MGERRGRDKQRRTNRGLRGMDKGGVLTVGVVGGRVGMSNGEKGRTTVIEQQ